MDFKKKKKSLQKNRERKEKKKKIYIQEVKVTPLALRKLRSEF